MSRFERYFSPPDPSRPGLVAAIAAAVALIFLWLLLSSCASMSPWEKAAIGASALDVATTAYGLEHGAVELNPLLSNENSSSRDRDIETLGKVVVVSVAVHLLLHKLFEHLPAEARDRYWIGFTTVRAGASAWNLKEIEAK